MGLVIDLFSRIGSLLAVSPVLTVWMELYFISLWAKPPFFLYQQFLNFYIYLIITPTTTLLAQFSRTNHNKYRGYLSKLFINVWAYSITGMVILLFFVPEEMRLMFVLGYSLALFGYSASAFTNTYCTTIVNSSYFFLRKCTSIAFPYVLQYRFGVELNSETFYLVRLLTSYGLEWLRTAYVYFFLAEFEESTVDIHFEQGITSLLLGVCIFFMNEGDLFIHQLVGFGPPYIKQYAEKIPLKIYFSRLFALSMSSDFLVLPDPLVILTFNIFSFSILAFFQLTPEIALLVFSAGAIQVAYGFYLRKYITFDSFRIYVFLQLFLLVRFLFYFFDLLPPEAISNLYQITWGLSFLFSIISILF